MSRLSVSPLLEHPPSVHSVNSSSKTSSTSYLRCTPSYRAISGSIKSSSHPSSSGSRPTLASSARTTSSASFTSMSTRLSGRCSSGSRGCCPVQCRFQIQERRDLPRQRSARRHARVIMATFGVMMVPLGSYTAVELGMSTWACHIVALTCLCGVFFSSSAKRSCSA